MKSIQFITKLVLSSGLLCIVILGVGCNSTLSYVKCTQKLADNWAAGKYEAAHKESSELLDKQRSKVKNNIVFFLEHGAVLRAAGQFEASNQAFESALSLMNDREQDPTTGKVGREAVAAIANLNVLIYRGYSYDRIMAHTYRALNYMVLDDLDNTRIEFRRLHEAQATAVDKYSKQITKDEKEVKEAEAKYRELLDGSEVDKLLNNEGFQSKLALVMNELPDVNPAYGPFVNPFSEYLQGLFFTINPQGDSDLENGLKSLQRVLAMSGNNKHVATDVLRVNQRQPIENITYILFEAGIAPYRKEEEFKFPPIPIKVKSRVREYRYDREGNPIKDSQGNHMYTERIVEKTYLIDIKAKWPKLIAFDEVPVHQLIKVGGRTEQALPLADMNSVVAREFQLRWPGIRNRIILATILKTTGHIIATKEYGDLGYLGGALYTGIMKETDSRTWRTLPSNFQVCRVNTPANRKLKLGRSDGGEAEIDLIDGSVNVVYVKQTTSGTIPKIFQFKLK